MINDKDVLPLLCIEIPELRIDLSAPDQEKSIFKNIKLMADLACQQIARQDPRSTRKILEVAERLFKEGSEMTKMAVDNIFIFSISTHAAGIAALDSLWPDHLRQEYHRQLYCSGM